MDSLMTWLFKKLSSLTLLTFIPQALSKLGKGLNYVYVLA